MTQASEVAPRLDVIGVPIHSLDARQAVATIEGWAQAGAPRYVCFSRPTWHCPTEHPWPG